MSRHAKSPSYRARSALSRRDVLRFGLTGLAAGAALSAPYVARAQALRPLRIGFPAPLTGPYAFEAGYMVKGAQLAVEEFNASGGLGGRHAELLVRDDMLLPSQAAQQTRRLILDDGVDFIVGGLSAATQLSINAMATMADKIYISTSQSDSITEYRQSSRYTFHEALTPHMTTQVVGKYVFPRFGKRVAFLVADYAYGHEMLRGFKTVGEGYGITQVAEVFHPIAAEDFSPFLLQLQAAKPDVICVCNFGNDQARAFDRMKAVGLDRDVQLVAPILLNPARGMLTRPDGSDLNVFQANAGVIGGTNYVWNFADQSLSAKTFNARFQAVFDGDLPTDYAGYGYSGTGALLHAVQHIDSADTAQVIDALEGFEYDTYKGAQRFRECDHQSEQSVLVVQGFNPKDFQADKAVSPFQILDVHDRDEKILRTCAELGHI